MDEDFFLRHLFLLSAPLPNHLTLQFIATLTATVWLTRSLCFHFQVGVEIRDELQLLGPSEVRDDISREVSNKRRMLDTIRGLGDIIWHRHVSVFHKFALFHVYTNLKLSFLNNQLIIDLTVYYSTKFTITVFSFAFNVLSATCSFTKNSRVYSSF